MVSTPTDREPTHPGKMLLKEFLVPLQMTQRELASAILVPYQRVNELVRGGVGSRPAPPCGYPGSSAHLPASG